MVLRVGAMLHDAKTRYPDEYDRWVEQCLPFGADKARRLRMIHLAVEKLPAETLARLPRPWQALYAVARLPTEVVVDAVESGEIGPDLSTRCTVGVVARLSGRETNHFSEADIIAGRLLARSPSTLDEEIRARLVEWINDRPDQPNRPVEFG